MDNFDKLKVLKDALMEKDWQEKARAAGWRSGSEIEANYLSTQKCRDCLKHHDAEVALNERSCMAAEGWTEPGEVAALVAEARREERVKIGEWLENQEQDEANGWVSVSATDIEALKSGKEIL